MTIQEQEQFRTDFRSIVYVKGLIAEKAAKLKQLHHWDKNGSHENAINKQLAERIRLKEKFNTMLKGLQYEDWLKFSRKLSVLNSRLRNAITQKEKVEIEIGKLNFNSVIQTLGHWK